MFFSWVSEVGVFLRPPPLKIGRPMGNQTLEVPEFGSYYEKVQNAERTVAKACK